MIQRANTLELRNSKFGGEGSEAIRESAFSLMEMVLVIAIMGILAGFTVFAFDSLKREQGLRDPALELETFARRASRSATSLDREFQIGFQPDHFFVVAESQPEKTQLEYRLDSGVNMQIRRWNTTQWITPGGETWIFPTTGISEPLSVRFSDGDAFIELDFNPLTGAVDAEREVLP